MKMKSWIKDALGGLAIGTGILPGVSVGTIGMIVDVYDKLINSMANLRKDFKRSVLTLIPIGGGCLLATFILMWLWKNVAYPYFPFPVICALAGVVVGSLPFVASPIKGEKWTAGDVIRCVCGAIVAAAIGVFSYLAAADVFTFEFELDAAFMNAFESPWVFALVFAVGLLSAVACLVPGISGSMIMFIFGLYNPIIGLLISQRDLDGNIIIPSILHDMGNPEHLWGGLLLLGVLLIGMLIGFLATSKAMTIMLEKHKKGTFTLVIGFIIGSIVSMFFNNDMYLVYIDPTLNVWYQYVIGGVVFVGFAILLYFLTTRKLKKLELAKAQIESQPQEAENQSDPQPIENTQEVQQSNEENIK